MNKAFQGRCDHDRHRAICLLCLLPIIIIFIVIIIGCGGVEEKEKDDKEEKSISFIPVIVPSTDEQKRMVSASSAVTIDQETHAIGYQTILRSGANLGGGTFGMIYTQSGSPVATSEGPLISNDADFSSFIQGRQRLIQGKHRFYNLTQFDTLPGAIYVTELEQDQDQGGFVPLRTFNVEVSQWGGLWRPGGGGLTPWGSHMGGESHEPDAKVFQNSRSVAAMDDSIILMLRYFGIMDPNDPNLTVDEVRGVFNPYIYGYPIEAAIGEEDQFVINKRYAMGRLSVGSAYVMPDERTVYLTDNGNNAGLYLFMADEAGDLSAGNLFAAKWNQQDTVDGGMAKISWIELGHANQDEIHASISSGLNFTDIFDVGRPVDGDTCPEGYTSINTGDYGHECLAVRTGMDMAASRLETRRYAAVLGATTEFSRESGITYDKNEKMLYISMGEIGNGMEDNTAADRPNTSFDEGGENDIRLPYNACGCVYALKVGERKNVGSKYAAGNMSAVLCGEMGSYTGGSPYYGNVCNVDNIANPSSLAFIPDFSTLIIAENSARGHQNNALWAYHVQDGGLTRIETAPYGAQSASAYFYPNLNDAAYLISVIKHPYGQSDQDKLVNPVDASCYVGFIGPMPVFE